MKIVDVSVQTYRWPRPRPIRNGMYTYRSATTCVVELHCDEGTVGVGLSADPGPDGADVAFAALVRALAPMVIGEDPLESERIWSRLWQPKLFGRRGFETRVISAIDIAVWDLKGKILGQSVHRLLGAAKPAMPYYIAGGYYEDGKSLDDLATEMRLNVAQGATAMKMKIGGAPIPEDVERVRIVREAIGPDTKLMVDANGAYRAHEAISLARQIEGLDICWFEEPVTSDDYRGLKRVADNTIIPVAAGENEYTRYGFRDLIASGGVAIINADAQILGGISEFLKVAAYAQAHNVAIAPHGNQDIHVHLVAGIQNGLIVEYYGGSVDPTWAALLEDHLTADAGLVRPPDRPGLGIRINHESAQEFRVR